MNSEARKRIALKGRVGLLLLLWGFVPAVLATLMEVLHLPGGVVGFRFRVGALVIVSVVSQYLWSMWLLGRFESPRADQTRWVLLVALLGLLVNTAGFYAGCSYLYARAFEGLRPGV